jgi:hypothetical protein
MGKIIGYILFFWLLWLTVAVQHMNDAIGRVGAANDTFIKVIRGKL